MLKLMYITNDTEVAKIADNSGVDRIFIDLEINGKEERQGHLDTVISKHDINDVGKIKPVLTNSKLLVRVNPIYDESKKEIDAVIEQGADIVMLPFFKTVQEVQKFIELVNKRARVCLLCETPEAVDKMDEILSLQGIDEIHIGLNDLHLGYKMKFMFQLLTDGTVESLCQKFKNAGVDYGFGGVARPGGGDLPAEMIIKEHYRLGSTMVILSRSFYNTKKIKDIDLIKRTFETGVSDIRKVENEAINYNKEHFEKNRLEIEKIVDKIVNKNTL